MSALVVGTVAFAGCEWNSITPPDAYVTPDAAHFAGDGNSGDDSGTDPDAMMTPAGGHLLLTEIALAGTEFIEIENPTSQAVDLSHYFLCDNGSYFTLPVGPPTMPTGDFIVQFPAASSIAPGGVITVATGTAAAFMTAYAAAPTYSIADSTMTHIVVTGTPTLTDAGEIVVLFQWDGTSHLVKDVDMMIAGHPTAANGLVSKSGMMQLGSPYATDANSILAQPSAPASGKSTKRIAPEAGFETETGTGNGIVGDDETSEDTSMTWDKSFSAPTPGLVPSGL